MSEIDIIQRQIRKGFHTPLLGNFDNIQRPPEPNSQVLTTPIKLEKTTHMSLTSEPPKEADGIAAAIKRTGEIGQTARF